MIMIPIIRIKVTNSIPYLNSTLFHPHLDILTFKTSTIITNMNKLKELTRKSTKNKSSSKTQFKTGN